MKRLAWLALGALGSVALPEPGRAEALGLTETMSSALIRLRGESVTLGRSDEEGGDPCPPACLRPIEAAPGVATLGELELIAFLEETAGPGLGVLIDARLPDRFAQGSIPGAVNVPAETLGPGNPWRIELLRALGALPLTPEGTALDFEQAFDLVVFDDGNWSDEAAGAIRALIAAGYPAERIGWYRGGMDDWRRFGLTQTDPLPDGEGEG